MIDRFIAARLKIKRANKHIADLEGMVVALPNAYIATIERNSGGGQSIKYTPPDLTGFKELVALIIGDAIHNIRVAVEYAYLGAVETHVPSILDPHTKFPTGQTRKDVEGRLKGRKIDVLCPKLFNRIVSDIKPYEEGGNCFIKMLHDLDISDKHWLLVPTVSVAEITDIVVEDEKGNPVTGNTWPVHGDGPYFIDFGPQHKVKNKGKLSVDVLFDEIDVAFLKHTSVVTDLKEFSEIAACVIELLNKIV